MNNEKTKLDSRPPFYASVLAKSVDDASLGGSVAAGIPKGVEWGMRHVSAKMYKHFSAFKRDDPFAEGCVILRGWNGACTDKRMEPFTENKR